MATDVRRGGRFAYRTAEPWSGDISMQGTHGMHAASERLLVVVEMFSTLF